jgi:putative nucleotidyltransferase with HDIG domain
MMMPEDLSKRLYWTAEAALLACTIYVTARVARPEEWQPIGLVALLLMLTLLGEWLSIETHRGTLSASFVALVIAMSLLGPGPAVTFGIAAMMLTSARRRLRPVFWLGNLTTYAVGLCAGALMVRWLAGDVHDPRNLHMTQGVLFALIVFTVFITVTGLNFVFIALDLKVAEGRSLRAETRELFLPVLSGELATGVLATILVIAYTKLGMPMLFGAVVVLLIFRHLSVALLRSEDRAEQLEARSRQLVGLQLGVLRTLVRALGMRDPTTARHAAAVASYAKALAIELGYSEQEQETVQVAGLLHDIGKFAWPDRILHAETLGDEDLSTIKSHPQEGAIVVGALDGYGEVADAILYHHERLDGRGYPAGLIGSEIPVASRIIAICSTYDTMITSHTIHAPISPEEAMVELRNAARNGQFDPELVESFIALLERRGPTFAKDADFETELDFERRVRQMAGPHSADPAPATSTSSDPRDTRGAWRAGVAELGQRVLSKR